MNANLTKTEIRLVEAEIHDRLARVRRALNALVEASEEERELDEIDDPWEKERIPEEVFLFTDCGTMYVPDAGTMVWYQKIVRKWVRGTLTEELAHEVLWHFMEVDELDWGWVFLETSCRYYGKSRGVGECREEELIEKFVAIGTRNAHTTKRKQRDLHEA